LFMMPCFFCVTSIFCTVKCRNKKIIKKTNIYIEFISNKDYPTIFNAGGFKSLKEDDRVSFDIEQGQKGPAVANVTVN